MRPAEETKAKVNQLHIVPFINEDVLQLQVSVHNVLPVKIPHAFTELFEEEPGLLFRQHSLLALALNVLVQADSIDVFLDQVDFL